MTRVLLRATAQAVRSSVARLQRKCASGASCRCHDCERQKGWVYRSSRADAGDVHEQEADRIADRVLSSTSFLPPYSTPVSDAPAVPQRDAAPSAGLETAAASSAVAGGISVDECRIYLTRTVAGVGSRVFVAVRPG
jgi:hypothetical protein